MFVSCVAVVVSLCALVGVFWCSRAPLVRRLLRKPRKRAKRVRLLRRRRRSKTACLNPNAAGEVGEYEYRFRVSETECEGERSSAPGMVSGAKQEAVPAVQLSELQPHREVDVCSGRAQPWGGTERCEHTGALHDEGGRAAVESE